jgi:hypothetical protein
MTALEAKRFVLSIYPKAFLGLVGGNTIVFHDDIPPEKIYCYTKYLGYSYDSLNKYKIVKQAWIDAAENIQKEMLRKLES